MPVPRYAAAVGSPRWIASLAAVTAITALSIDISLPAQPVLARTFDVDSETAQLTLSVFLIGYAVAQIFVGYLSDAFGRRRVLLTGLCVFALAGAACAASPSIEVLIACRLAQGIGAAAGPVVGRAMVRDTQPATQAARLLSTMLAVIAVAPMIAPVIGGALLHVLGWRAVFATLAVTGISLVVLAHVTLVETLPVERRQIPSLVGLFKSYGVFVRTPGTRLPILVGCATFAGQFAYIADSPFVLMGGFGVSPDFFGFYFATTALALMCGSLAGGWMLRAGRTPRGLVLAGTSLLVIGGALVVLGSRADLGIAGFIVPVNIYFFGCGMASPSATALALEPVPRLAGTGSAAIGCSTMIAGAIAGYETTRIGGSSPATFAIVIAVMGALAFALALALVARGRPGDQKQQESR